MIPSQILAYSSGEVLHSAACVGSHHGECRTPVPQQIAVGQQLADGARLVVADFASMRELVTLRFPDWDEFRLASAGHRLIEHGWMIAPGARLRLPLYNGWLRLGHDVFVVPVISTEGL